LDYERLTGRLHYKKAIIWAALAALPAAAEIPCGPGGNPAAGAPVTSGAWLIGGTAWNSFFIPPAGGPEGFGPEALNTGGFSGGSPKAPDRWSGRDKARHFTVSFMAAGAAGYEARHRWNRGRTKGVQWGFGAALSAGILKEICDMRRPGGCASLRDLAADLAGAACGCLLVSWW
jgi:putative lipoprotein